MTGLGEFITYAEIARLNIPPGKVDWRDSPFAWMRHHGPRTKSKLGRDIVQEWLLSTGETWRVSDDQTSHFKVHGRLVVVHLALQGKEGMLEFANLREPGLGADRLWLLGIEPFRVRLWSVHPATMVGMHSYANDAPGYHNCSVDPDQPPAWAELLMAWSDDTRRDDQLDLGL